MRVKKIITFYENQHFSLKGNISYTSDTGKNYDFNTADTLNTLLLNCMFASGQQKEDEMDDNNVATYMMQGSNHNDARKQL